MDPFRTTDAPSKGSFTGITAVEKLADLDTLVWEGVRLIVRAPRPMPAWRVGRNRRTAVHFRGVRYAVVEARVENAGYEYVLEPWPARAHDHPSQDILYDEAYVLGRESAAHALRARRTEAWAIAPLWPLLGVLPSAVKQALHARYGFSPLATTRFSVWVELSTLPMLVVLLFAAPFSGVPIVLFLAVLVDSFFRVSVLLDDDHPPLGIGEWIVQPGVGELAARGWRALRARVRGSR